MHRGFVTIILGLFLYGGLLWIAVAWRVGAIEADLIERSNAALENAGGLPDGVRVALSGRDAVLSGEVADDSQRAAAERALAAVSGLRTIESRIAIAPPLQPAGFAIEQVAGNRWELDGRLADPSLARRLKSAALAALPAGAELDGDLVSEAFVEEAPWAVALAEWFAEKPDWLRRGGGLLVLDGKVVIAGEVHSSRERDALLAGALNRFEPSGLSVEGALEIVDPPKPAELSIASLEDGGLRVAGRLRNSELGARLLELIATVDSERRVEPQLEIGDHVADAPWAGALVQVIPALIAEVASPQLTVSDAAVAFSGSVGEQAIADSIAEMAAQAFEGYAMSIDNGLKIVAPPRTAFLSVARDENGAIRLEGLLPEDLDTAPFIEAARAAVGPDMVLGVAIERVDAVEPAPWLGEMTRLLGPFIGATRWGALSVHGRQAALEAEVFDGQDGDVLAALVGAAFPEPEYATVVEVRVAEPEGPSDEDIAALEAAVNDTVIYFSSGSSRVGVPQAEKLAELVEAFDKVPGASLALIGHADPLGNAAANRRLSRKRCEAVRAALEELGVDFLLMEIEERGEVEADPDGKAYESGRRVEFELR